MTRGGLRCAFCSLFLIGAVLAAVGAVASPQVHQGGSTRRGEAMANVAEGARLRDDAAPANIIVVTNTNDNGLGSLRDALAIAQDGDTIDATGISGTILLTSGELQITHSVSINGPGAGSLAVDGNHSFRVFENFASNVTISSLTITNGFAADNNGGGGILNHAGLTLANSGVILCRTPSGRDQQGGGIKNNPGATLTLTGSTVTGNGAGCEGGGIYSSNAQLTVTSSTISGNGVGSLPLQCAGSGGGIFYTGEGTLTVTNSMISGNRAGCSGGGMALGGAGTTTVTDSTISGNSAGGAFERCGYGGGISNSEQILTLTNTTVSDNWVDSSAGGVGNSGKSASLNVINSTFSGNSSVGFEGGGILNGANLTVANSTFSGNSSPVWGGGIFNFGAAEISNTVLNAGDFGGTISNSGGTVTSLGYNLASDAGGGVLTGPGDQINTDPMLGPLQDNGGPTFTHELLPGSPAIHAGDPSFTPPPFYDQRGPGFDRVVNGRIDIGSFEVQGVPTPTPTPCSSWTPAAPVPYNAGGMFAASDGTYVYAGGGGDINTGHNDLLRYDPVNNSWMSLAPSPDEHALSQAVYFKGKLYNMGGFLGELSQVSNTTRIYNIATNTWTTGAPMPAPLGAPATMLWNGVIYVAGGFDGGQATTTLYAYDIASDTWTTLAPMPQFLYAPAFGAIDGKLYVAGGYAFGAVFNALYIYDIAADTWTPGAKLLQGVGYCGSAVLNGELYVYGGVVQENPRILTNSTQIYNPGSDTWRVGPNMNVTRWWVYGTAVGNQTIVLPGGVNANIIGFNDNEQLINTPCSTPTPTPTATATMTPTATPTATVRPAPMPRPRPTPAPRP
jgi:N-acetylneuraminic acid mutarotase